MLVTLSLDDFAAAVDEQVGQPMARETKELRDELASVKMQVHELQEKLKDLETELSKFTRPRSVTA